MAKTSFPWFRIYFRDPDTDQPAAGYLLEQYNSGTTTDQDTFADADGTTPHEHPLTLDEFGGVTMFGTPGEAYTFVLLTPDGLTVVDTIDDVAPAAAADSGDFLPRDGSEDMLGLFSLSGPGTAAAHPVTKAQMESAISTAQSSLGDLVDDATAAAAAATAAAAAVKPTRYGLWSATGAAVSRTISGAKAGTYAIKLETAIHIDEGVGANYTVNATQAATVGTTTVNTAIHLTRSGGSGYGRDIPGTGMATGTFTLAADGDIVMSMAAVASLGTAIAKGSTLEIEKVA
jgi:hypothetical protein